MNVFRYRIGRALVHLGLAVMPPGRPRTELYQLLAAWGVKVRAIVAANRAMSGIRPINRQEEAMTQTQGDGWQPIETAPRDGTIILGYWRYDEPDETSYGLLVWWGGNWAQHDEWDVVFSAPDLWHPLPSAPAPDSV